MLTLKELKQTYDNSHPDYEQLMNRADITDKKLNKIKREILQPYLEDQISTYNIPFNTVIMQYIGMWSTSHDYTKNWNITQIKMGGRRSFLLLI